MTQDEFDEREARREIAGMFPAGRIGAFLAGEALAERLAAPDDAAREAAYDRARYAARFANAEWRANAYGRDGDLGTWFSIPALGYGEAVRRGREVALRWERDYRLSVPAEDDEAGWVRHDAEEAAREAEEERIERIEEEGGYGRTLRHLPEADNYLFVRFGRMPRKGRSVFGLAGEDTEDGPDPWRQEMGGMTHEAGTCVLRAYRHPDVEGAYVVMAPYFEHALYGVPSEHSYWLAIIPRYEAGEHPTVLRVDGFPVTLRARDGTGRLELGSDGEYLVDPRRPVATHALSLETVYLDARTTAADFLLRHRGRINEPAEEDEEPGPAP